MSDTDAINNKVASIRENYRNAVNEVRADAKREVDHIRESSEAQQVERRAAYDADKNRITKENERTVSEYTKDISEKMDQQSERFRSEVNDLKKGHDRERYTSQRDFNNRLDKISEDYRTKEKLTGARSADLLDQAKKNADRRMERDAIKQARDRDMFTDTTRGKCESFWTLTPMIYVMFLTVIPKNFYK